MRDKLGKKKSRKKLLGLLGILGLAGFLIWRFSPLVVKNTVLELKNVSCVGGDILQNELSLKGENMLFVKGNMGDKGMALIKKYPCIKSININQQFPQTVKVQITGRVPLVRLASYPTAIAGDNFLKEASPSSATALVDWSFVSSNQDTPLEADDEGWIFKQESPSDLPILFLSSEQIQLGRQIKDGSLASVAQVLNKLPGLGLPVDNLKMGVINTDLLVGSYPKLLFSLKKEISRQVISLQLILQKAKIDEKVVETVDLRFDKPVVRFVLKTHG